MKCVIIAHGTLDGMESLQRECSNADYIICADGGAEYAFRNNIAPDLLIGDFDSIDSEVFNYFRGLGIEMKSYPIEKDYTDTEICIDEALRIGADEICIAAGVGGRLDHSLGNVFLLSYLLENNVRGYISSDHEYIYICNDSIEINGKKGDIISIIPIKEDAEGLYTKGLKYMLNGGEIKFGRALGISNVMEENICTIKIEMGTVLVVKTENK